MASAGGHGYTPWAGASAQPGGAMTPAAGTPATGAATGDPLTSAIMGSLGGSLGSDISGGYGNMGGGGFSFNSSPGYMGGALHSDPSQAQISPDILNSMSQYSDAAYQNATRTLDPQ